MAKLDVTDHFVVRANSSGARFAARMGYRRLGDPDSPRKVLLVHGVGITRATWHWVQPILAEQADTVAIDMLGFGDSQVPLHTDTFVGGQVHLVEQVLDQLGWSQVAIVGHSMGGLVGLASALAWRRRVRLLVQVAGAALPQTIPGTFHCFEMPFAAEFFWSFNWLVHWLGLEAAWAPLWSPDLGIARRYFRAHRCYRHSQQFVRVSRDLRPRNYAHVMGLWGAVTQPALLLHGQRDGTVPVDVAVRLAKILPGAELKLFPRSSHMLHEDPANRVGELAAEFLARHWPA